MQHTVKKGHFVPKRYYYFHKRWGPVFLGFKFQTIFLRFIFQTSRDSGFKLEIGGIQDSDLGLQGPRGERYL